ncbi:MAG: heavy metal translocating P-type ATPase, partial [bacterium]
MKFQILHESKGRIRLRAAVYRMSMEQADALEEYTGAIEGVDRATVHESSCTLTILYNGERKDLIRALSRFSFADQEDRLPAVSHSSREISAEYKGKILRHAAGFAARRLLLPLPVRRVCEVCRALPYIVKAVKTLLQRKVTVEVLDGTAIGVSLLTG